MATKKKNAPDHTWSAERVANYFGVTVDQVEEAAYQLAARPGDPEVLDCFR